MSRLCISSIEILFLGSPLGVFLKEFSILDRIGDILRSNRTSDFLFEGDKLKSIPNFGSLLKGGLPIANEFWFKRARFFSI